jgi:hypothetical protein
MTDTDSRSLRLALLTSVFITFNAAVVIAAVVFTRPAPPAKPPAAVAHRPAIADAAPLAATPTPERDSDDATPPDLPDPEPATTEPPSAAIITNPPPGASITDPIPAPDKRLVTRPVAPAWTPDQLQANLLRVPEVSLQPPSVLKVPYVGPAVGGSHPLLTIVAARADLHGLPVRPGPVATLPRAEADALRDASVLLRKELGAMSGEVVKNRKIEMHPEVLAARPQIVTRVLNQLLQTESVALRQTLLKHLDKLHNPAGSRALAHRAVYEPRADLRQAAVRALAERPPSEYLPVLLDAFNSVWPPAADHAADALTALTPADAVPNLIHRLETPDPTEPFQDSQGVPMVRELVRINHARNCLLCHAQSVATSDGVRVAVPNPAKRLPSPFSLDRYQGGGKGGSKTPDEPNPTFVRPDITYIQQDFSWKLPVANPGPWPAQQRYDFVVRIRPAGPGELALSNPESPQKKAVVRALRAVTGQDFGDRAADWRVGLEVALKGR